MMNDSQNIACVSSLRLTHEHMHTLPSIRLADMNTCIHCLPYEWLTWTYCLPYDWLTWTHDILPSLWLIHMNTFPSFVVTHTNKLPSLQLIYRNASYIAFLQNDHYLQVKR